MELVCPECMGALASKDGKTARCTTHGGEYQVLFCRPVITAENGVAVDSATGVVTVSTSLSGNSPATSDLGLPCTNHPGVNAAYRCQSCGAPICGTCAFKFPGNVVVCPGCAASPKTALSPKRRKYLVSSFICATIATLFMGAVFSGAFAGILRNEIDAQVFGIVMMVVILGTTIPGTALAASARLPGRSATIAVWIASAWNIVLLAGWILLCLIGSMMK